MDIIFSDHPRFADDLLSVLENSKVGKVKAMVSLSSIKNVGKHIAICNKYPQFKLYTTCGLHPHNTNAKDMNIEKVIKEIERIVQKEKHVIAIGETGIDLERKFYPLEQQKQSFSAHVQLAIKLGQPLMFIAKHSHDEIIDVLKLYDENELLKIPKIINCYDGFATDENLEYYKSIGCYFGICGLINDDTRNENILKSLLKMSADKIITMTYGPYFSPVANYKSEPQYMQHIIKKISDELQMDINVLIATIEFNWKTIFPLVEYLSDEDIKRKTTKTSQFQNTMVNPKNVKQHEKVGAYSLSFLNMTPCDEIKENEEELDLNDETQFPSLSSASNSSKKKIN